MSDEKTFGRQPITLVEIDRDVCSLTYGVAPCTAAVGVTGTRKCFNTFKTCQDRPNYAKATQTLRFAEPVALLPAAYDAIPSVISTTTAPTVLNVGGADDTSGPLGKRAVATITLQDHPYGDSKTDPYVSDRPYNPYNQGTLWTKLLSRWPYYHGREVRIIEGYVGQNLVDMVRRHYLIDTIDGPDSDGIVRLRAIDPLRQLDDRKSQAPRVSTGELLAAINESVTTLTVEGDVTGDYPATGTLRIGAELMTYTGRALVGSNTNFTGLTRGTDGTEAAQHAINSRVQTCIRITDVNAWEVARDLIQEYAPAAYQYIDLAQWSAEATQWLDGFIVSAVISEPTGLNQLLAELCRDAQFLVWWDEREQAIKLRANRPADTIPTIWNESNNILAGSQSLQVKPDERISQVWFFYQPRNATASLTDEGNYGRVRIVVDAAAESPNEYGEPQIRKIFSRWVRTDAIATAVTTRLLNRYRDKPFFLTLEVDAKDRAIWTADIVDVDSRLITTDTGEIASTRYQVISAEETEPGHVVRYVLQNYDLTALYGFWMVANAPIYANATDQEKLTGGWWADNNGLINGDDGYEWQ